MSITPNLINDNCSILPGLWAETPEDFFTVDSGFHGDASIVDGGSLLQIVFPAGNQVTQEVAYNIQTVGAGYDPNRDCANYVFFVGTKMIWVCNFTEGVVVVGPTVPFVLTASLAAKTIRIQYNAATQNADFYLDGAFVVSKTITQANIMGDCWGAYLAVKQESEAHFTSVKMGDGLGDFGGSTVYSPGQIVRNYA